jgi:IclR family transcriptional regulator, acetate operon repressor
LTASTTTTNMRSLERALDVLGVLQVAKKPMRLSEVARAAGLHVATTQRILNVLLERGFAARAAEAYTAGPAALAVAHAFIVTNPLGVLAQQTLQLLAAKTSCTASLHVRVEHTRVVIARVESGAPLSYVLPVGERLPLHLGGAGKTFLADLPAAEVDAILDEVGPITLASGATQSRADIKKELKKIRGDGYAVAVSERLFGIASIVAPVRTADGALAAVIGITEVAERMTEERVAELIPEVRNAAITLGQRIPTVG